MAPRALALVALLAATAAAAVTDLDEHSFASWLSSHKAGGAFVDFYSPTCPHCISLAPAWEQLPQALSSSSVAVARVDAKANSALADRYGVDGYPTLLLFKGDSMFEYTGTRIPTAMAAWATSDHSATQMRFQAHGRAGRSALARAQQCPAEEP